nr:6162_t:CDS:2 [Entrophospora candida]
MKAALDQSIKDGTDDIVICVLQFALWQELMYLIYVMMVYIDGIYCMFLLGEFGLSDRAATWGNLMNCFQVLATVQEIVEKSAASYQSVVRKNAQIESLKLKMTRETFHRPMKISSCWKY